MRLRCVRECRGAVSVSLCPCVRLGSSRAHSLAGIIFAADHKGALIVDGLGTIARVSCCWAQEQSCARPDAQARQIALGESERFYFELLFVNNFGTIGKVITLYVTILRQQHSSQTLLILILLPTLDLSNKNWDQTKIIIYS